MDDDADVDIKLAIKKERKINQLCAYMRNSKMFTTTKSSERSLLRSIRNIPHQKLFFLK